MQFKTILLWSVVNGTAHPALDAKERIIEGFMPLVSALFPGINYYSIMGFNQVINDCVAPALKKRHPELEGLYWSKVNEDSVTEVAEVLPSDGYEWQRNDEWRSKFQALLAAPSDSVFGFDEKNNRYVD